MEFQNNFTKEPLISIIITYYNLGKYINDCILSILSQTYTNWEVIIVNDGSDKRNTQILNRIKNEKIKIIELPKNEGQLCAFCAGLKNAKGEFICMVDSDDILLPNYLKTLLYVHLTENSALVSCSCGEINDKNEITSLNSITNRILTSQKTVNYSEIENLFKLEENFKLKKVKAPFGLWSWNPSTSGMFRKSSLDILQYFPDKEYWKTGADKVIFSFLHLIGGSVNISAVCYLYRHHRENNSKTSLTTGDKKMLNEEYINKLINWNVKIRLDAIKMFKKSKSDLIKKYNRLNYYRMFFKIIFCINIKIVQKLIKTFAHKIVQ